MKNHDTDPRCTAEACEGQPSDSSMARKGKVKMPTRRSPVTEACNHLERAGEGAMSIRLTAHCENTERELVRAQSTLVERTNELENLKNATQHSGQRFEEFADAVAISLGLEPGADCDAILRELNTRPAEPMHIPPAPASMHTLSDICNAFRGAGIHVNGYSDGATPDNVIHFVNWVLRKFSKYEGMLNDIRAAVEPATGMALTDHSILEMVNELIKRTQPEEESPLGKTRLEESPLGPTRLEGLTKALVTIGEVAGAYHECLALQDDADAQNIVEAVRGLKGSAESHQHAHKQVCGQFGATLEGIGKLLREYSPGMASGAPAGASQVNDPLCALEDLLVNLRANQMPEGFQHHADVLVRSNARYEAALSMIQNAVALVKDA